MPPIVQWVLAGVTLVTFLAAAAVFLRGSADKGTITSLQNSVNALKIEGELKDAAIAKLEREAAECAKLIEAQEARIAALERVVTSADLIVHLQAEVEDHHSVITSALAGLAALLHEIARKVGVSSA